MPDSKTIEIHLIPLLPTLISRDGDVFMAHNPVLGDSKGPDPKTAAMNIPDAKTICVEPVSLEGGVFWIGLAAPRSMWENPLKDEFGVD